MSPLGFATCLAGIRVWVLLCFTLCLSKGWGRFEVLLRDNVLVLLTETPSVHTVGKEGCPSIWMKVKILKEISPEYPLEGLTLKLKLQYFGTWCEEQTHLKRPWCWERLEVEGEEDNREWDGCMASPTRWTWVWISSRSWWWTGKSGMLQSMESQRVGHDWATELNWTEKSDA